MGILNSIARYVEKRNREKESGNYVNIVGEAREYNAALNAMGLHNHTEEGVRMRKIGMLEITSKKFEFLKNYKQELFLKDASPETRRIIENKSKK